MTKQKIIIVMRGLNNTADVESQANKFFKKQGFGILKKKMVIKTTAGRGQSGGRTDIVFLLNSPNIMKFGVSGFRFSSGTSWGQDYIDNDGDIITEKDMIKLQKLVKRYGG